MAEETKSPTIDTVPVDGYAFKKLLNVRLHPKKRRHGKILEK